MLDEIVSELEGGDDRAKISLAKVRDWMKTDDIHAMGALYHLLSEVTQCSRIHPPPSRDEVVPFLRRYFSRCINEDPQSAWADSRHSAGWDLANLLRCHEKTSENEELLEWSDWLADLYRAGSSAVRLAVETAILEHILDKEELRRSFSGWLKDPELAPAFGRSMSGPGPLTPPI
jgi:hypothetical protein